MRPSGPCPLLSLVQWLFGSLSETNMELLVHMGIPHKAALNDARCYPTDGIRVSFWVMMGYKVFNPWLFFFQFSRQESETWL